MSANDSLGYWDGDTENRDYITCPYCGWEDNDSAEMKGEDSEELGATCECCGNEFIYQRNITISYTTKADPNAKVVFKDQNL